MAFPGTPQRPLPGAFFSTPALSHYTNSAPLRQPIFRSQSGGETASPVAGARELPKLQALPPVQRAARTINDVLQREAGFPDLDSYVRQGISSDYDIPNNTTDAAWAPFQRTKMYDIPDRIFEQYNRAEVSTMMGLFAEINHAWVTIDNCMYMWDYTNQTPEVVGYEDQPNSITAVKLVVPRAGVFVSEVTHLLVVATTAEIILLGVSSSTEASPNKLESQCVKTVSLYATKMSLSIRGANINVIEGCRETGRIFFAGKTDSSVYELTYQQEEKWFANRCGKVNHSMPGYANLMPTIFVSQSPDYIVQMVVDDSRGLLYTLSSESSIRTYHMDTPATLKQVIEKKRHECLRDISHMISQSALLTTAMKICTISPISAKEGTKLHLMATTTSGCRLFLSATRGYGYLSGQGAPQSMQVQHIKFPPRIEQRPSTNIQPYGAEPATDTSSLALTFTQMGVRFPPGLFLCFVTKQDSQGRDSLFLSGPDTGRIAVQARDITAQATRYFEQQCWLSLNSHAEDVGLVTKPFGAASHPIGFGNELAVQYDQSCQEVAILTNTGVHIIRRRRLVDIFAAVIRNQGGDEALENEIKKFILNYGRAETAATALAVACGQGNDLMPGDPRIARFTNTETLELARKCFVEYGGRPSLNENMVLGGPSQAVDNVRPSARHEGLAIYMARLVRSVWKSSVITQVSAPAGGAAQITSTVTLTKLISIQEDLMKLEDFLDKNKAFIEGLAGPESLQRVASQQEEIALQGEHQALHSLQRLNSNIVEGISFVKMLFDEGVDQIWVLLDDNVRQRLRDLTFEVLFSSDQGKDLAKVLVKAIVNRNIAKGSNVDTVADALRRRCGSFCSADDVIIFKAQEQLKRASEVGANSDMGRKLLNESLKLFIQVAGSLSFENLQSAVNRFTSLQFYAGAITLALLVAQEFDRGNRALAWVNENKPANDARISLYRFRKQCYDLIHQILENLDASCGAEPDLVDGRPTLAATKRNEAHQVVNNSDDELFQFDLYDWYLAQGLERILLAVDSDYVVQFLTKSASADLSRADLLWKFHQGRENFYDAALVQLELAKSDFTIPLSRRIEYLSRAKANASALSSQIHGIGRQARQILQYEVSELLDVANIQDEVLHRLRVEPRCDETIRANIVGKLDGRILDLTVLYNDFADPAAYFDICLTIYEAASHRNDADITSTWQQLLDATHNKVASDPAAGQLPYEAVITMVREMARRLSLSESTFNPHTIIPMLERYALERQYQVGPRTWVPELFIDVGLSHEVIVGVLQAMWYENLAPFSDRRRRIISEHILYVIKQWYEQCMRTNLKVFGSDEVAEGVLDLLNVLEGSDLASAEVDLCSEIKRGIMKTFR